VREGVPVEALHIGVARRVTLHDPDTEPHGDVAPGGLEQPLVVAVAAVDGVLEEEVRVVPALLEGHREEALGERAVDGSAAPGSERCLVSGCHEVGTIPGRTR
jgi:hypothetical protein